MVVDKTARTALSRCLVHVLPLAVTATLLWLNLGGMYIGLHLQPSQSDEGDSIALAFLQVAAKIQVSFFRDSSTV